MCAIALVCPLKIRPVASSPYHPPSLFQHINLAHTVRKQTRTQNQTAFTSRRRYIKSHLTHSHNKVLFLSSCLGAACQLQCLQSIPLGNLPFNCWNEAICDTVVACCESDMHYAREPQWLTRWYRCSIILWLNKSIPRLLFPPQSVGQFQLSKLLIRLITACSQFPIWPISL